MDAGVEASGDQVGAAVPFGRDIEDDLGVVAGEFRESRPDDHGDRHRWRDQPNRASRLRATAAELSEGDPDVVERGPQVRQQVLARLSGCHRSRRPGEEPDSQALLQGKYRVADRGPAQANLRAAFVKLRSSATTANAAREVSSSLGTGASISPAYPIRTI
jgi:hypothetical protein